MPRSLTLIALTLANVGAAWVLLGFWGVRWLMRHSREPSPPTQAVYDSLDAGTIGPNLGPICASRPAYSDPSWSGCFTPPS